MNPLVAADLGVSSFAILIISCGELGGAGYLLCKLAISRAMLSSCGAGSALSVIGYLRCRLSLSRSMSYCTSTGTAWSSVVSPPKVVGKLLMSFPVVLVNTSAGDAIIPRVSFTAAASLAAAFPPAASLAAADSSTATLLPAAFAANLSAANAPKPCGFSVARAAALAAACAAAASFAARASAETGNGGACVWRGGASGLVGAARAGASRRGAAILASAAACAAFASASASTGLTPFNSSIHEPTPLLSPAIPFWAPPISFRTPATGLVRYPVNSPAV